MATYYSDQIPSTLTPATPLPQGRITSGTLRMADVTYTMVGTEAQDEDIRLLKLAKGTKIYPQLSDVDVEVDLAATATIDVGYEPTDGTTKDDDKYATALACSAVGRVAFDETHMTAEHTFDRECWLIASFASLVTPAAGGRIRFRVVYREA